MKLSDKIAKWIKTKVRQAGAKGCVVGLSGGIDSAVVSLLCKRAFPQNTLGVFMPCHSLAQDLAIAKKFAKKAGLKTKLVELSSIYDQLFLNIEGKEYINQKDLACANIKPRLRMATLYYMANKHNYLVIGTGNKSELTMGYFTKYGDGGVDLLPLGNLLKTQVRKLAKELNVPQEIIDRPPSAGLWHGQTDEGEMGITYSELDKIIAGDLRGIDAKKIKLVKTREKNSLHKRKLAEIF